MLTIVILILNFSPIICTVQLESKLSEMWAVQPESKLIGRLNKFFNFDFNNYVLEASRDFYKFIDTTEQPIKIPQSLYIANIVGFNINAVNKIKTKNSLLIVVPVSVESSLILLKKMRNRKFQTYARIALFFTHTVSIDDLRRLFEWCWKYLIIKIFAVTYSEETVAFNPERLLQIFTYNPFGTFDVIDVTDSKNYDDFFLRQNSNFQNYTLYLEEYHGKAFVRISDEKLWNAVFGVVNASFKGHKRTADLNFGNGVYIAPRVFDMQVSYQLTMYMYTNTLMILVPEASPYSEFAAYLVSITSHEFFRYSFVIIAVTILFLSFIRYIKQKKFLLFQCIVDVGNLLLNDNGYILYRQLSRVEGFIIVPLTFAGMVIVNGILSNLQSYLTEPIMQPEINTVDDLHKSGLLIYSYDKFYADIGYEVASNSSPHLNWSNRFFEMDGNKFDEEKETFNRSAAYIEDLIFAKTILRAQKTLDIKGYRNFPEFYLATFVCSYNVHDEFPFLQRFNDIVQWIVSAGLYDVWLEMDYGEIRKKILKSNVNRLSSQKDIDIDRFPLPMFVVYGWFASVMVFVIEIIWKKLKFPQLRRWSTQLQARIGIWKF